MNSYYEEVAKNFVDNIKTAAAFKENKNFKIQDMNLLESSFHNKILSTIGSVEARGIDLHVAETIRTDTLQEHYYHTGFSKIKKNGMHKFGIAVDILCLDDKKKMIEDGAANEYTVLRKTASDLGLHLLPLWDAGHIQAIGISEQNALRGFVLNYRAKEYVILAYGSENHYVMNLKRALKDLKYTIDLNTYFFGEQTDDSLRKFQSDHSLIVDGIAGKQVHETLMSLGYNITKM